MVPMQKPARNTMRLLFGVILGALVFYCFYLGFENAEATSTGFNVCSRGLTGWDYSFREHVFENGEGYSEPILIDSERTIKFGALFVEAGLCLVFGFVASFLMFRGFQAISKK